MPRVLALIAAALCCVEIRSFGGFEKPPAVPRGLETVRVEGAAEVSVNGGKTWRVVRKGLRLGADSVIKTGPRAFVDLRFEDRSLMRVTEGSVVGIDKAEDNGKDFEIQVDLKTGRIVAQTQFWGTPKFEVKTPVGICWVRAEGTSFDASSRGTFRCVRGKLAGVYVVVSGIPTMTVAAGEAMEHPPDKSSDPAKSISKISENDLRRLDRELSDLRESALKTFADGPIRQTQVEVLKTKGDVSVSSDGGRSWKASGWKRSLKANYVIKTAANAFADLRFADGTLLRVTGGSVVWIDKADMQGKVVEWQIDLKKGRICVDSHERDPISKFEIRAPFGVVAVHRQAASLDMDARASCRCVRGRLTVIFVVDGVIIPPLRLSDGEQCPPVDQLDSTVKPVRISAGDLKKLEMELQELRESAGKRKGKRI